MGQSLTTFQNGLAHCIEGLANGLLRLANGLRTNQPAVGEAKASNVNETVDGENSSDQGNRSPPPSYLNDRVSEVYNSSSEDLSISELLSEVRRRFQDQVQGFTDDEIIAVIRHVRGDQDQEIVEGQDAATSSSGASVPCLANPFG